MSNSSPSSASSQKPKPARLYQPTDNRSLLERRKAENAAALARQICALSETELRAFKHDWQLWGRAKQLPPPGIWNTWNVRAGRGFGKTRTGAEWVNECVRSAKFGRFALVGATAGDARDIMVEGESGILAISPPTFRPRYEPAKRRVTWPNGALAFLYTADEPERLRGPQHDAAWLDEFLSWRFMQEAYDQLQFGLRLGENPQQLITSTPKPHKLLREIEADPNTVTVLGATSENRVNLAPTFLTKVVGKYEGTRLGRQELEAEILDDNPGALWKRSDIEKGRVRKAPDLKRIVVAIDPAVTNNPDSDETGICVAGLGADGHAYVLEDATVSASPQGWCTRAIKAYKAHEADRIVAEVNNGGDLVETVLRTIDGNVPYTGLRAAKGKYSRAEPVGALYEQGKVHHVGGFAALEDQMCDYDPTMNTRSPDRMDALVWALTELMLDAPDTSGLDFLRNEIQSHQRREASENEVRPRRR